MGELDYAIEPEVECTDNDPNDVAFVWATVTIGGHDALRSIRCARFFHLLLALVSRACH
jgi:hypothetical protein